MGPFYACTGRVRVGLLLEAVVRLGLATLLTGGLLIWAVTAHFQGAGWQRIHGWTGTPGPALTAGLFLGQALLPEKGTSGAVLSHVSPRFATYAGRAKGAVELVLLRGADPPRSQEEIDRRRVHSRTIPVDRLVDNELGRFSVPGLELSPEGLFLLVRRPASGSGESQDGPLTVWLDSDPNWTGGQALVLTGGPGGAVASRSAGGHLSLGWGYDRPSIRVFLARKAWLPWAFGGLWLGLGLISLAALPKAGQWLGRWWSALSREDPVSAQTPVKGRSWLPWVVLGIGAVYTLYLQGLVQDGVFYSGDAGIKLLMIKQFLAGNLKGFLELPEEGWVRELWAQGLYPFEPPFIHLHEGHWFVAFPLVFPLLNAPMFAALGFRGLYLIPLAAGWLLWLRFYAVGRSLNLDNLSLSLGLAGLVLASPLTLYTAMFWGHTLAVLTAFTGMSLALFPRGGRLSARSALLAGLITGLGVWFRAETVCLGGATALTLAALGRPGRKLKPAALYTLGFGCGAVLLWLAVSPLFGKYALGYGHFLGHHAVISGTGLDLSGLVGLMAKGREAFVRLQANLYYFFPLAGAVLVLLIGLAFWKRAGLGRHLRGLVLVYALFILSASPILEPPGKQWGPRYMFLMLPLICLAAALAWQKISDKGPAWLRLGAALVLALALVAGGRLNLVQGAASLKRDYAGRVLPSLEFIKTRPERVVAVSDQHIAQELADAFEGWTWFHTREPGELLLLVRTLHGQGLGSCLFLYNDGEPPPRGFSFEDQGARLKAGFAPLGKKGRYRVEIMTISPL